MMDQMADATTSEGEILYVGLVRRIEREIARGRFSVGDKLYSIQDIRGRFSVSRSTAEKAVEILKGEGIVKSFPKKGNFVQAVPNIQLAAVTRTKLARIVVYTYQSQIQEKGFQREIFEGIFREAQNHDLMIQLQNLPRIDDVRIITKPLNRPAAGDGVALITSCPEIGMQLLFSIQGFPKVIVDAVTPQSPCVVTDNHEGMREMIGLLKKMGHERLGLVCGMLDGGNPTNENERRESFERLTARENLRGEVLLVDEVEELIPLLLSPERRPTAMLFTRDDPAVKFIDLAEKNGLRVPDDISVTGFDDYSLKGYDLSRLTTLAVDRIEMGRRAARALLEYDDRREHLRSWTRVKGKLMIRDSVGKRAGK